MKRSIAIALLPSFFLLACDTGGDADGKKKKKKKDDKTEEVEKKTEEKTEEKKEPVLADEVALDLSGPKPPESSVVVYAVDGALIPLACFDKDKKKLSAGPACGALAPKGEQVFLWSEFGKELDTLGEPKNALCEMADVPKSVAVATVDGGRTFDYAVWPKSAHESVVHVPKATTEGIGTQLSEEETKAVTDAILASKKSAEKGDFRSQQRAELDFDGDGKNEIFISAVMVHPTDPDRHLHSGLWMAQGGDLTKLRLVESSNRNVDIVYLRQITDIDGDKKNELWLGIVIDGGNGDAIYLDKGESFEALAKWTCGA